MTELGTYGFNEKKQGYKGNYPELELLKLKHFPVGDGCVAEVDLL